MADKLVYERIKYTVTADNDPKLYHETETYDGAKAFRDACFAKKPKLRLKIHKNIIQRVELDE